MEVLITAGYHDLHTGLPTATQPSTDVHQLVMRYAEYLRSVYKIKPCGDQWLRVVSKSYVTLSVVESIEDFPKEKEDICRLAMVHSKIEEVKWYKRTIQIGQVGVVNHTSV